MDKYHPNQIATMMAPMELNRISCDKHKDCKKDFFYVCRKEPTPDPDYNGIGIVKTLEMGDDTAKVLYDSGVSYVEYWEDLQVLS